MTVPASNSPASSPVPVEPGAVTSPHDEAPAWFRGHQDAVTAKLESIERGYNERLEKFKAKYLETAKPKDEQKQVSQDDLHAALSFGRAIAHLSDEQQTALLSMAETHGYSVAAQAATLIPRAPANTASQVAPPKGVGASPSPSQPTITSLREYRELKKSAPEKARALLDAGLEINKLR